MGLPADNILVVEEQHQCRIAPSKARLAGRITAGKCWWMGWCGDVGNIVLRDRSNYLRTELSYWRTMNEKRWWFAGPDIVSRGFVYVAAQRIAGRSQGKGASGLDKCQTSQ